MENNKFGKHQTIYEEENLTTNYPKLEEDIKVDIAIIGGGIVGLTLAYLLKDSGQRVAIFEADRIAMGMSMRTTAKLTPCHNLIYNQLVNKKGVEQAKKYAQANIEALRLVKDTVEKEKIDCDLHASASYVYTIEEDNVHKIKAEVEAYKKLGMPISYMETLPLNLPIKAALKWEEAYTFHIRKYLLRIAELFVEAGGKIYEETPIQVISPNEIKGFGTQDGMYVHAKKIIIASHFPMYDGLGFYFTRLNMKRNYVIAVKVDADKIPEGNYISADTPHFSIRPVPGRNIVLIGGGEHRTGDDKKESIHFDELKAFAKRVFNTEEVLYHWSTQDYITPDKTPYIGYLNTKIGYNIYVATGFNKWGMTGGTCGAMILKDMIMMGYSEYEELFNPMRVEAFRGSEFFKHNGEGVRNYIQGKLRQLPREVSPQIGEAVTAKLEDGNIYGIYLDEEEQYHIVDLICPHVGALLRWNSAEKSWDCPFHGSRFSVDGEVLEGPSTHRLNSYKEGKNHIYPNLY